MLSWHHLLSNKLEKMTQQHDMKVQTPAEKCYRCDVSYAGTSSYIHMLSEGDLI